MFWYYLLIGLGAAFGAICRFFLSRALPLSIMDIPLPILLINVLGCFIMGALKSITELHPLITDGIKYFLIPGFIGAFTTFSTFTAEFILLIELGRYLPAIFYAIYSFIFSVIAFLIGVKLFR